MGSGKSYWLNNIKRKSADSEFLFLDIDDEIANSLNILPSKLGDWIRQEGWPAFRKIEARKINILIDSRQPSVISLGGGTLNQDLLEKIQKDPQVKMVFLDTEFETCYERITGDSNRPLLALEKEELRKLFNERRELYLKADLILNETERKEIEAINALVHTLNGKQ
jgi:shikimate kinase